MTRLLPPLSRDFRPQIGSHIRLDVCCNDPDNGLFAHIAEQLQVTTWDGEDIEFEAIGHVPHFRDDRSRIRLCRRWWPILGGVEWYGNWCWNAYFLAPNVALDLLEIVKRSGLFHCSSGPTGAYENWNEAPRFGRALWAANLIGRCHRIDAR